MSGFDINNNDKPFCPFTNPQGKKDPNPALEKIATLMRMYPDELNYFSDEEQEKEQELEREHEREKEREQEREKEREEQELERAKDAAALKIITELQEIDAARVEQHRKQEEELYIRNYKNPHELYTKKWWRWDQYGDDSHMDCKSCGERVGFPSRVHCSDRCLINNVGFEAYQDALRVRADINRLRYRPEWLVRRTETKVETKVDV